MRHTLLPTSERAALRREYRIRALIVLCFTLCLAGFVGIGALFPAFMKASDAAGYELGQLSLLQKGKDQSGITAVESQLSTDSSLVSVLSENDGSSLYSALVEGIALARGDVTIDSFALSPEATGTFSVTLQGTAPTRNDLIAFEGRLEAMASGNKVDLPVSELGPSTDVPYSLEVTGPIVASQP